MSPKADVPLTQQKIPSDTNSAYGLWYPRGFSFVLCTADVFAVNGFFYLK